MIASQKEAIAALNQKLSETKISWQTHGNRMSQLDRNWRMRISEMSS